MIRRLSYVACDGPCGGNPAQPTTEGAKDARLIAQHEGFIRRDGQDLCPDCAGRHGFRHDSGEWQELAPPTESETR